MVGVTVNLPIPVLAAALNSLTAVGADEPAGTDSGYVIEFVGLVQVPLAQLELTAVAVDAEVESSFGVPPPVENVVDVTVTFQPVPDPVASLIVIGRVYVGVWSVPSRVAETLGVALVASDSVPADTVAVAVTFAATADEAARRTIAATETATNEVLAHAFFI
jgi:hypothetical protein